MRRGFALVEVTALAVVAVVVIAVLLPGMHRRSQMSKLDFSRNNLRQIIAAQWEYRKDAGDQPPMRGHRYSNGQIADGWDGWNYGGKNCNIFWAGGPFDESAYARPLNSYLTSEVIPVPPGYQNIGSGSTWTFNPGTPTAAQRTSLEIPVFRSPGDTRTYQRQWPNPTPSVTAYNDIGTSYILNMDWWSYQPGLPTGFTPKYNAGTAAIRALGHDSTYIWIADQVAELVLNSSPSNNIPGEFGGLNKSVLGFLDGRAEYMTIQHQTPSGPGYRFIFQ